ncbi:uncharacterized protein LOC128260592 [Drosophila gunungcola]|uniref:uncharacterized protein LOC128260592 n=1 Tax=Drosophila gunungcola TaxID=103775 RepID=UPI0022DF12DF|nr:uncharacterized protein LOC128260592 [Drosophila gunungcola]
MSGRWIIFIEVILVIILSPGVKSGMKSSETQLEEGNQKLNLILEAINELERQRLHESIQSSNSDPIKQRLNSKRLKWNRRRTIPDPDEPEKSENRAWVTSTSNYQDVPNPDYINVNNYLPTPAPWWFN